MSAVVAPRRQADTRPQLKVVQPARPVPMLLYALTIIMIIAAAIFGTVTLNALAAADAVEARALERAVAEGERAYAQLVADLSSLENPERIRQAALDLGMVPAGPSRHLVVERVLLSDGVISEPLPGDATDPLKPYLTADH